MSINHIRSAFSRSFRKFLRNTAGNMSMVLGVAAIPTFIVATAAIDTARITREQTAFYNAVDSAALAIAADDRSSFAGLNATQIEQRVKDLEELALSFIKANYADTNGGNTEVDVDIEVTGQHVKLTADLEFPTLLAPVLALVNAETRKNGVTNEIETVNTKAEAAASDFATLTLHAESTVNKAMRPIELVMVMDTTGSMSSGGKLAGAKAAAQQLLTKIYGGSAAAAPRSEYLRVALVPFSGAVRLNPTAHDFNLGWIDTTGVNPLSKVNFNAITSTPAAWNNFYAWSQVKSSSTAFHSWNGCVEARMRSTSATTSYNTNDAAPVLTTPATLFPAYFSPDTRSSSYGVDYVTGTSLTAVGSECRGLTSSVCSSTTSTNLYVKQENYQKYISKVVGTEASNSSGPWTNCTATPIVPMTYDRAKIEAGIAAMTAKGPTVIPEGLAWGWRAISPTEPFTKVEGSGSIPANTIAPYNGPRWQKIMVLMTDGDNDVSPGGYSQNGTTYTAYGFQNETLATNRFGTTNANNIEGALDTAMDTLCSNIKNEGVKIYVSAFGTGISLATKNRLKACASGAEYYNESTTSDALAAFFDHIGQDVLNKMVYVAD